MKTKLIALFAIILSYGANCQTVGKPYDNPANVFGSNFGDFFISMLGNQHYDMALKFTSKESIQKFGAKKVLESYTSYDYNYKLKVKSIVKVNDMYIVKFTTNEFATGKFKEMRVVIENDSCKIVLQDLKIFK
ncbi:MAG TPA: hypothetical protein VMX17_13715 [Candidatus Glassbacteria bacterium]|nr:hypothetical protein [Candidatus Glassbacteria bacterium]